MLRQSSSTVSPSLALGLGVFAFLYAPILVVALQSLNSARHGAEWKGLTFTWYSQLAANDAIRSAAWNTLQLAISSTLLSTLLGTALAYGLSRFPLQRHTRWAVDGLTQLPTYVPDIVLAAGFLVFFELARPFLPALQPGLPTMVCAHVTVQIPFVSMVVRARLAGFDRSLEEAAHDLGATPLQTFRFVTWPILQPGVAAGALLAFTISLDDFILSFFTSGPGATTLPMFIYSSVKRGVTPEINALSTLLIIASALAVAVSLRWQSRSSAP